MPLPARLRRVGVAVLVGVGVGCLTACSASTSPSSGAGGGSPEADPSVTAGTAAPAAGACRELRPADVQQPDNDSPAVDCTSPHTAETFAVGPLPGSFDDAAYDDARLGVFAYQTCSRAFERFLGADESQTMRTVVTWAWFRPSEEAWDRDARWYRCDVVGGGDQSASYVDLPRTARGLLRRSPDRWMVCVNGPSVEGEKIPCSQPHLWRAVTTIVLAAAAAPYPGDAVVETRTRDYCSTSVGAWMGYPVDYDFGYTFFHRGEWAAGNRRSVCWARTAA